MNTATRSNQPRLSDSMAHAAEHGVNSAGPIPAAVPGSLAGAVQDLRDQAAPLLTRATEQVGELAQRGVESVRITSQRLRDSAQRASDNTLGYIRAEPVKATLIAAAAGAALMALLALLSRSRGRA